MKKLNEFQQGKFTHPYVSIKWNSHSTNMFNYCLHIGVGENKVEELGFLVINDGIAQPKKNDKTQFIYV